MMAMWMAIAGNWVSWSGWLSLNVFAVAMILAVARLLIGPTLADRVVALDLVAALAVGMIALYAIQRGEPMLLRAAIVVALVVFVGTIAFAKYLEKREGP